MGGPAKQLKAMSGAVAVLATGFAQDALFADIVLTLRDPFVRAELMRDWSGEATQAFGAMQGQLRRYLLRSGVLSVAAGHLPLCPPQAAQFWPAVCQDSGLTEGMPARALVHFLLTTPSRVLGAPAYARHVASAWNAFYEQHRYARSCRAPGRIRSALPGRRMTAPRRCSTSTRPGWCSTRRCRRRGRRAEA